MRCDARRRHPNRPVRRVDQKQTSFALSIDQSNGPLMQTSTESLIIVLNGVTGPWGSELIDGTCQLTD